MISNAFAGALIQGAGSDEQKAKWLPGIASGEAARSGGLHPGRRAGRRRRRWRGGSRPQRRHGRRSDRRPGTPTLERLDLIEPRAPTSASAPTAAIRSRATSWRPSTSAPSPSPPSSSASPSERSTWRRVRQGARAVRPADRRLPGRVAPARRDALGGRGGPLAHLLRGLGGRCPARVAAARGLDGEGPRLRSACRSPTTRSRRSAASASPGSTTSTSCSSAPACRRSCSARARQHRERVAELAGLGETVAA